MKLESGRIKSFSLSPAFSEHLDSIDARFLEEGHKKWKSINLCVDPILKYKDPVTNKSSIDRFNTLLEEGKLDKAILIGDGGAGKTFLSKKLFKHFHSKGFTPLLVRGYEILRPDIEYITGPLFQHAFEKYYSSNEKEHFDEVDKNRIVLIIDDFNGCRLRSKYKNQFVKNLNTQVERVIFCSKSIMFFNVIDSGELSNYQRFNLIECSYLVPQQ